MMIRRTEQRGRDGISATPGFTGRRWHEPTSQELTSPDALTQLTRPPTNRPGHVHAVLATVAISRCTCISRA